MGIELVLGITIGTVAGLGVILGIVIFYFKGKLSKLALQHKVEKEELERQMQQRTGTIEEYQALTAQIEELRQLRDNLNNQVGVEGQELAATRAQIESAKSQFDDWQRLAAAAESEVEQSKSSAGEVLRVWQEQEKAKLLAELEAEREKGLRRNTELEAELAQRVQELEARAAALESSVANLAVEETRCRAERDAMAASHAEALRRLTLENGEGGCIRLTEADKNDVRDLRRLCRGMKCENAILKATFDVYVKPEVERLIRDQGVAGVSGIYRIWRKSGEREISYIGQAVDIGERWKTHAKRAWGIDNTGRIMLYQAMMESGIEEWHWELVEAVQEPKCGSGAEGTTLSERERYWGGFYGVKELGLNKKLG